MAAARAAVFRELRPPPIRTSMDRRPSTAPSATPTSASFDTTTQLPSPQGSRENEPTPDTSSATTAGIKPAGTSHGSYSDSPQPQPGHQRFVLTDPIAFRYLEDDPATAVLERKRELQGYECFVVEQWTTSRSHPTFTITTYTGDPNSVIQVGVLSVPSDESVWSARLRVYFKALNQYHAKRRETPLGILMVTNLSGFPSSLTVIPVPDGDLRKHRSDFFVNENLKRLNCSGRVGLTLVPPTAPTIAKFHQLYRTSDKNEIYHSVIELIKLCQTALVLFDRLEVDYADGLLCDVTERGVNDWWAEIGSAYFNVEPQDGILGPTTVAGLLGLLLGARNRLHAVGAPVAKDPFDVESMKKGISAFQKQQRIARTRRLDRRTLERLHKATQKAANSEAYWTVPKAVKSTVAELSGRGDNMVDSVVHRKDRAGIAEIETCDIERFVQLIYGERAKWLWYGRALKTKAAKEIVGAPLRIGEEGELPYTKSMSFRESEHGGFTWTTKKSFSDQQGGVAEGKGDGAANGHHHHNHSFQGHAHQTPAEHAEGEDDERKGGLLKRTIKGAVGLGSGHQKTQSKDITNLEPPQTPPLQAQRTSLEDAPQPHHSPKVGPTGSSHAKQRPTFRRAQSSPVSSPEAKKERTASPLQQEHRFGPTLAESIPEGFAAPTYAASYREVRSKMSRDSIQHPPSSFRGGGNVDPFGDAASERIGETEPPSVAGSVYNDVELNEVLPTGPESEKDVDRLLKRTQSTSQFVATRVQSHLDAAYPRHLSFSLAEDSVLTWQDVGEDTGEREGYFEDSLADEMAKEVFEEKENKQLRHLIAVLNTSTAAFTQSQLLTLQSLISKLDADERALEDTHTPFVARVQSLQASSGGVLRAERERLEEASKEIETLAAKLDYEVNALKGKVEEVQAGVGDFAKGVARVEERVGELEKEAERAERGWGCWVM